MIIKSILFFATLLGFVTLVVYGVQNEGLITIDWFGYYIEINAVMAIALVLLFVFLVQVMMHIMTLLGVMPGILRKRSEIKRLRKALNNFKDISINISLGNVDKAKKLAKKTNRILPSFPIFDEILNMKSKPDLSNDIADLNIAKNKIEEFISNYEDEKALKIVENILKEHPKSVWARQKQYGLLLKLEDFAAALNILELLKKEKTIPKQAYRIEKSFINYELAVDESNSIDSLYYAETSLKSSNNFMRSLEHAALILVQEGELNKAVKLVISFARNFPDMLYPLDLLHSLIEKLTDDEKVKTLEKFYSQNMDSIGGNLAYAESLLLQGKSDEAIEYLESVGNKSKEILLFLSSVYKDNDNSEKAIECLELSNKMEYTDKGGLEKEYILWQKNMFYAADEDDKSVSLGKYTENEVIMIEEDGKNQ